MGRRTEDQGFMKMGEMGIHGVHAGYDAGEEWDAAAIRKVDFGHHRVHGECCGKLAGSKTISSDRDVLDHLVGTDRLSIRRWGRLLVLLFFRSSLTLLSPRLPVSLSKSHLAR